MDKDLFGAEIPEGALPSVAISLTMPTKEELSERVTEMWSILVNAYFATKKEKDGERYQMRLAIGAIIKCIGIVTGMPDDCVVELLAHQIVNIDYGKGPSEN